MSGFRLSYFFSQSFLGSPLMLWGLFWVNLLGTIYGYIWYGNQLEYTLENYPPWLLPFVPDSPTASLFFTWFLVYMLRKQTDGWLRRFVEAFAVITSLKYGVWAVAMIFWGASQGDPLGWQDWMLSISHLGMAAEALLYFSFYRYRWGSVLIVAVWTFWNDVMDYQVGVYPWLPSVLEDDLGAIEAFTITLSVICVGIAVVTWLLRERLYDNRRKSV